jgi:hypothetical protein
MTRLHPDEQRSRRALSTTAGCSRTGALGDTTDHQRCTCPRPNNFAEHNRNSLRCHLALARTLLSRNDLKGALREDLVAQKLAPQDADIDLSLAAVYMKMQRGKDAAKEFETYYHKTFTSRESPS